AKRTASEKKMKPKTTPEVAKKKQIISVKMDVDKSRLSHILRMREVFSENRGQTPVQVHFVSAGDPIGTLHVDEKWGVTDLSSIQKELTTIEPVLSVND